MADLLQAGETLEDLQLNGLRLIQKKDAFRFGMDTVLLAVRSLFLMNRKDLRHAKTHNPITRLSFAIAEGLHKIGLVPAKLIHPRAPDDERYGTYLTNAISFGLLLTAAGIVVGMLYMFIRMGH